MRVTIFSTFDTFGGASIAASRLHQALGRHGVQSCMLVQDRKGKAPEVYSVAHNWLQQKIALARFAADRYQFAFYENSKKVRFVFSQAQIGIDVTSEPVVRDAEVFHLHWVNFGFLSVKSLTQLSKLNRPFVWTLHDMWAFTGGCHYSGTCESYQQVCGNCEHFLKKPSADDLSHQVWLQKKALFEQMDLTLVACSEWLAEKARQSSLLQGKKVISIPNPVDTKLFYPRNKTEARQQLNLAQNKQYILFAAMKISDTRKGFQYFEKAIQHLITQNPSLKDSVELLVMGQAQEADFVNIPCKVNVLGRLFDLSKIATTYSAADVFVIPSLEENLPNTIMEAMACGTPVVGFETGGIPEMIEHLQTGYVAKAPSAEDLANGIVHILQHPNYEDLCKQARSKVESEYAEAVVAKRYETLYQSLL
ncbi:glycosyltransferase family 4 protein [Flectobacillus longus]|uniref:glycosyltransferase family 4 protein n=1 Tax=Flectobacillus longus TaxID=2984207 RepID=UPI0024B6E7A1|nr:glycosyltransferase family 4 protein [Flectobacillus longus]MDI9879545.1 glycosyltransferase family 4 protein [Flectobacillus longus]